MPEIIQLDGSTGEGGGQILRTSLSLSMVTGQSFRIENIRAGRQKPGLLRQHLTAVLAAAEVCGAEVEGANLGSKSLAFAPGAVRSGTYKFAVGTAGSATLVLQTLLPGLMLAASRSMVTVDGGTHNRAAPPFDFLEKTFLPMIRRMGPRVAINLNRYGFYPAGGGSITLDVDPVEKLCGLELPAIRDNARTTARAIIANLPRHIATRELAVVAEKLGLTEDAVEVIDTRNSAGPGNVVMVECHGANGIAAPDAAQLTVVEPVHIFTAFGRLGATAEQVAAESVEQAERFLVAKVAADEHLADQLLLPMALGTGGSFTTTDLSSHSLTNMEVITKFLGTTFSSRQTSGEQGYEIRVFPHT